MEKPFQTIDPELRTGKATKQKHLDSKITTHDNSFHQVKNSGVNPISRDFNTFHGSVENSDQQNLSSRNNPMSSKMNFQQSGNLFKVEGKGGLGISQPDSYEQQSSPRFNKFNSKMFQTNFVRISDSPHISQTSISHKAAKNNSQVFSTNMNRQGLESPGFESRKLDNDVLNSPPIKPGHTQGFNSMLLSNKHTKPLYNKKGYINDAKPMKSMTPDIVQHNQNKKYQVYETNVMASAINGNMKQKGNLPTHSTINRLNNGPKMMELSMERADSMGGHGQKIHKSNFNI